MSGAWFNQTMRLFVAAIAAGIWLLQQQADLPSFGGLAGLGAGALVLLGGRKISALATRRFLALPLLVSGAASLGFAWAGFFAQLRLADELPAALEGRDIEVSGVVAGLPQELERGVRFEFDVEQAAAGVPSHISLAWYRGRDDEDASPVVPVRAGERWRFTVRLKRPHGNLNPHGFEGENTPTRRSSG